MEPRPSTRDRFPEERTARRRMRRRAFLRACGVTLGVAVALPAHARYVEPNLIDVTRHEAFLPDLPEALDGLRVAHLTDLHQGHITPVETIEQAIAAAVAEGADVVALTGDLVHNRARYAAPLARLLEPLVRSARLGAYAVLGNHDYPESADAVAAAIASGAGVRFLRNDSREILPGLHFAGVEDPMWGRPDMGAALRRVPDGDAVVILAHNPRSVFSCDERASVVLAGHTHGGQVLIPGFAPRVPPDVRGFPLVAGWGTFDRAHLYVNRGVGMSGLPLRFRCRPEVAILTLRRGDGPPWTKPGLADRAARKVGRLARDAWRGLS